jgi:hypothetical protein
MADNPLTEAAGFGKRHFVAFLLIVVLSMIVVVALEARKPGRISGLIARIPFLGRRILAMPAAPAPVKA